MTGILALLTQALRLDARRWRAHLVRLGFVIFLYGGLFVANLTTLRVGAPGLKLFTSIVYMNLWLLSLAGCSLFATAITEEKEEDTLGLLKLAGINRVSILLGKSTSRLIVCSLLLLVQVPFTLLSITLGGVMLRQVVAAYVALFAFTVLCANVAVLCSTYAKRTGSACGLMVLFLLGYLTGPIVFRAVIPTPLPAGIPAWVAGCLRTLEGALDDWENVTVTRRVEVILGTGFNEPVVSPQVTFSFFLAGISFCVAWGLFDRLTANLLGENRGWAHTLRIPWRKRNSLRVWKNALAWKDFQFGTGGLPGLIVRTLVFALWFAGEVYYSGLTPGGRFVWSTVDWKNVAQLNMVVAAVVAVIELSIHAARIFNDELRQRTFANLLMLPRPMAWIAWSKAWGCLLSILPALAMFVLSAGLLPKGWFELLEEAIKPSRWTVILSFVLFLHLTALLSLGVRWGGLPLAIAIMVVTYNCCLSPFFFMLLLIGSATQTESAVFAGSNMFLLAAVIGLQITISKRLRAVAEQ
jgi:ABC-type transport system involved in multi-copper enzyme maturation permease subunit